MEKERTTKAPASCPCHICNCKHQEETHTPCFRWKNWFKDAWHSVQKQAGKEAVEDES